MSAPFTFVEIFSDPTPRAIVNKRLVTPLFFLAQQTTDLSDDEHKRLFRLLVLCGKKLVATWRHLQRFEEIQARTVEKVRLQLSPGPNDAVQIATAQDLFLEFDEFLVQLKSTLDYLVKIPHVLLGNCWNLRTFGDKGGDVVKALQNNVPKKYENQSRGIEKLVMDKHRSWLEDAIRIRDTLNHCLEGDVNFEVFTVAKVGTGSDERIHVPSFAPDLTALHYMKVAWSNLIALVEDFIGAFLCFRLRDGLSLFHDSVPPDDPRPAWRMMTQAEVEAASNLPGAERV